MSDNADMTTTTQMVMIGELRKVLKRLHGVVQKVPFLGNTGAMGPAPEMDTISLWDGALKMRRVALQQSNQVR